VTVSLPPPPPAAAVPPAPPPPVAAASSPPPVAAPPVPEPFVTADGTGPKTPALPPAPAPGERVLPPPPSLGGGEAARDLVARVRSSGDPAPVATPPAPTPPPPAPGGLLTSSGDAQSLRERVAARAAEITGARARGEPVADVTGGRPIPARAEPPKVEAPVAPPPVKGRWRTPDGIRSALKGEPVPVKLARGPGGAVQKRRLPGQSTLAEVVGLLVGQAVPLRTTLDGRVAGWYRLGPAAGPLPADTRLDTLDLEQTLVFHFVESRAVLLDVEVQGADVAARLRAPVATAIPVATLVDALASLLDLPAADWVVQLDGVALEPFHVLEDRALTETSRLLLKRGP
jgi:hypothetical protein